MSKSTKSKTNPETVAAAVAAPTPEQLAVKGVQEAFDDICQNPETPDDLFHKIIGEVANAIWHEHEREHNVQLQDGDPGFEFFGQRAGYLVGVQVGLRLRSQGVR